MKIIECKEQITEKRNRIAEIVELAKTEIRDLSEDEQKEIDDLKQEIEDKKEEIKELQDELEKQVPKEDEEETKACDDDEKEEDKRNLNKYISRNKMKQISLVKEIRNAIDENKKSVIVAAETRAAQVTGDSGVHDQVVETQIEGILEPLYANSVLAKLGARWYTGLPMGDVQIPVMGKQTVKWEGETEKADEEPIGIFLQEVVGFQSTLPSIDFEEMHYAMATKWTAQDSAIEDFTVQRLCNWLKNCIANVIDQYNYQVNKGGFLSSKTW